MDNDNNNESEIENEFNLNQCIITPCAINTHLNEIDINNNSLICKRCPNKCYKENIGIISSDECIECQYHRKLISNDSSWCSIEECMNVIITHDNGLGIII